MVAPASGQIASRNSASPLVHGMTTWLMVAGCTQIEDLTPLKGMKLTNLDLNAFTKVRDFEPLKGMPLTSLFLESTTVRDLEPLRGMPLISLSLARTQVVDLTAPGHEANLFEPSVLPPGSRPGASPGHAAHHTGDQVLPAGP